LKYAEKAKATAAATVEGRLLADLVEQQQAQLPTAAKVFCSKLTTLIVTACCCCSAGGLPAFVFYDAEGKEVSLERGLRGEVFGPCADAGRTQ
jgi:hypothetical protein